jgi:16S rRNA (cytidine1402-2'-O)-methyltransferase
MAYTLYVVGTPIGNLEDISPRALEVLGRVALIACEDPPHTQRLLARYEIQTPTARYTDAYDRKKRERLQRVLAALRRGDVAYVTNAGMPLVSDPGYELIQAALEREIEVLVVPGPTAVTAALALSGLPPAPFTFMGFVPRKSAARQRFFGPYADDGRTLVVYESPNRLLAMLRDARAVLGERRVALANELTKLYESTWRGLLSAAIEYLQENPPRGEYVVVIGGAGVGLEDRRSEDERGGPAWMN